MGSDITDHGSGFPAAADRRDDPLQVGGSALNEQIAGRSSDPHIGANADAAGSPQRRIILAGRCDGLSGASAGRIRHDLELLHRMRDRLPGAPREIPECSEDSVEAEYHCGSYTTLAERLLNGPLTDEEVLAVAAAILDCLSELHAEGLSASCFLPVHILVDSAQCVTHCVPLLAGPIYTAHLLQSGSALQLAVACSSAPEVCGAIPAEPGPPADLYAAGLILHECRTGRPLFEAASVSDAMLAHMTVSLPTLLPAVPLPEPQAAEDQCTELSDTALSERFRSRALTAVIRKLLRKDPDDRYQSASAVTEDLHLLSCGSGSQQAAEVFVPGLTDIRSTLCAPPLVGRSRELEEVLLRLSERNRDRLSVVAVQADAGCGKSAFLAEILASVQLSGALRLKLQAQRGRGTRPLRSFAGIFQQITDHLRRDVRVRDELRDACSDCLGEIGVADSAVAAALRGARHATDVSGSFNSQRIESAVVMLIAEYAALAGPLVLLADDAELLDELSRKILYSLIRCLGERRYPKGDSPVVLLASAGIDEDEVIPDEDLVRLPPLSPDQVRQLVCSMAGPVPEKAIETVTRLARGNPFMTAAIMRGMSESGALTAASQGWVIDEQRFAAIRSSDEAVRLLAQNAARMPEEALRLLQIGAVFGPCFSVAAAAGLSEYTQAEADQLLEAAEQQYLIWRDTRDGTATFAHEELRRLLLAELQPNVIAGWHRRIAGMLESADSADVYELARHWDAAGDPGRAAGYAIAAACQAMAVHAPESAETYFRIAMRAEKTDSAVAQGARSGLADVLLLRGKYDEADEVLKAAVRSATNATDRARLTLGLGEVCFKRGRTEEATEFCEQALRQTGRRPPHCRWAVCLLVWAVLRQCLHSLLPRFMKGRRGKAGPMERLQMKIYSRLSYAYWYVRPRTSVLLAHLTGMNLAERYEETPELAQIYSEHAPAMSLIGLHNRGISYGLRSLIMRRRRIDLWGQGQSLHFLSIALYAAADYRRCLSVARRSVSILNRAGDFWEIHIARFQAAASLFRLGKADEAVQEAKATYQSSLRTGDEQSSGIILDIWSRATGGVLPDGLMSTELERPRQDVQGTAQVRLADAVCRLNQGDTAAAIRILESAVLEVRRTGMLNVYVAPLYSWLATARRLSLEETRFRTAAIRNRACRGFAGAALSALTTAARFRPERPHALREAAAAAAVYGFRRCSRLLFRASVRVAEKQQAQHEKLVSERLYLETLLEESRDGSSEHQQLSSALKEVRLQLAREAYGGSSGKTDAAADIAVRERFEVLLRSAREIASAMTTEQIADRTIRIAAQLLKADEVRLMQLNENGDWVSATAGGGDADAELLKKALRAESAVIAEFDDEDVRPGSVRSAMCCPVWVMGRQTACIYAASHQVSGLFGETERRLISFVGSLCGASLETAEGFRQLHDLNTHLEDLVHDRTEAERLKALELEKTARSLLSTQNELRAARDSAEQASRSKSEFLAGMSHEIRTPLTAIIGFTELLLRDAGASDSDARDQLELVHSNARHLLMLLNDLLDFSKIEAGALQLEMMPCDIRRLVADTTDSFRGRAGEKSVELSREVADEVPSVVLTDPTRFRQILTNLIGNALKFTARGSVRLSVDCSESDAVPYLRIRVADTGIGIDRDRVAQIFDPFVQEESSTSRRFGGTGLGLTISRRLARALGGDLSVVSRQGRGSTFILTVRCRTCAVDSEKPTGLSRPADFDDSADSDSTDLTGVSVLLTDDAETNRLFFSTVLQNAGAEVFTAENGREGVAVAAREMPDVVLMDIQMPVMNGYEAIAELRRHGFRSPVIALTANGEAQEAVRCRAAGFEECVTKPVEIRKLLTVVHSYARAGSEENRTTEGRQPAISVAESVREQPSASIAERSGARTAGAVAVIEPACALAEVAGLMSGTLNGDVIEVTLPDGSHSSLAVPQDPLYRPFTLRLIEKIGERLELFEDAAATGDAAALQTHAHWLKGCGGTVGLHACSLTGARLLESARSGNTDEAGPWLAWLRQLVSVFAESLSR